MPALDDARTPSPEMDPLAKQVIKLLADQNRTVISLVERSTAADEQARDALVKIAENVPSVKVVTTAAYALIGMVIAGGISIIVTLVFGYLALQGVDIDKVANDTKIVIEAVGVEAPGARDAEPSEGDGS